MRPDDRPAAPDASADAGVLATAAAGLRAASDARWVQVSGRVLPKALAATRRSHPVRAQAPNGAVHVSEQVLVAHLRAAIAEQVRGAEPDLIRVHVAGRDSFTGVTICVVAEYGRPLLPLAEEVRRVARAQLIALLGPVTPPVSVESMHVHFSDVTRPGH